MIPKLDQVVLSHAHLDHSGYLPYLYRQGCKAPLITTKPTRDLIQILLADYIRLGEGATPYEDKDVLHTLRKAKITEYSRPSEGIELHNAGHILGSAMARVESGGHKILYTGDINDRDTRLLQGTRHGVEADTLIIESTYGDPEDRIPSIRDASNELVRTITETFSRGGKVLIPTFAIGRGQELLFLLENYMRSGLLEEAPIYLDGMVNKVLRLYRHNALFLRREIQHRILSSDDDPFKSEHYRIPIKKDKSDVFAEEKAIILATSGMLNGGPVLQYLSRMAGDERNALVFTGYQAKGTRGRELLEGAKELQLNEEMLQINMRVCQAKFSGHADYNGLLSFAKSVRGVRDIIVVHGEKQKSDALAAALRHVHKKAKVHVPELGEEIRL